MEKKLKMDRDQQVDQYIASFEGETRLRLEKLRSLIHEIVPEAEEGFAYQMPSYKLNGKPLVYFAAFKTHIGFYATTTGHSAFKNELSVYKQGKGSVQFPLKEELPLELIRKIVLFRKEENASNPVTLKKTR